jgi:hypothetical protein
VRSERFRDRRGYATVVEAATAGTPDRYVRVLAVRELGNHAAVLVQENEPPRVIEALSVLERAEGAWYSITDGSAGDGSLVWTSTDDEDAEADGLERDDLGVGCAVYQLPAGVTRAVVRSGAWTDQLEASDAGWVIALRWPVTCADWSPVLTPEQ